MLKPVSHVVYGTDPELFLELGGRIIGSERVIPFEGLRSRIQPKPIVVRDGIQIELNPQASTNLKVLGRNISLCFEVLEPVLKRHEGVKICWREVVEVTREELDFVSQASRELGCAPSKNIYEIPAIDVPKDYPWRSAGGHLHFGLLNPELRKLYGIRTDLVSPFDIFVGALSVLYDRDPLSAERRKNYGRAGEYRDEGKEDPVTGIKPQHHGIEYRTLSNFWLRSYTLMSFVFGMAQIALAVVDAPEVEQELIQSVDINLVIKAIQENNFDAAMDHFYSIRPFLIKHLPKTGFQLNPDNLDKFESLARGIKENGLQTYFRDEPQVHWVRGEREEFIEYLERI